MKKTILGFMLCLCSVSAFAQNAFKGTFQNKDLSIRMRLNLDKADIPVPGLELDSCYGFIEGNINSAWIILKVKSLDDNKAVVRAMCSKGDAAVDVILRVKGDGVEMEQKEAMIKGIENRKYVKLPKAVLFDRY